MPRVAIAVTEFFCISIQHEISELKLKKKLEWHYFLWSSSNLRILKTSLFKITDRQADIFFVSDIHI